MYKPKAKGKDADDGQDDAYVHPCILQVAEYGRKQNRCNHVLGYVHQPFANLFSHYTKIRLFAG